MLEKLARIGPGGWLLLARAAFLLLGMDLALRLFGFGRVQGFAARRARSKTAKKPPVERLSWAVEAAGRRLGPFGTCLRRALALQWMLAGRGQASTLWLGADRSAPSGGFAAHAWLEDASGEVVAGGPIDEARFARLQSFEAPPR
jgi:hypothetical protein